jgi:DNA-binding response OmpR family regulator
MKCKILILEDEVNLANKLKITLEENNYEVSLSFSINDFLKKIKEQSVDIIILDRLIGEEDSLNFLNTIKQDSGNSQILILSAIDSPFEKANSLNLGADEYISKPFEVVELVARLKKLSKKINTIETSFSFSDIHLNLIKQAAFCGENDLNLSVKEFTILFLFSKEPSKIFTKERLLTDVWNFNAETKTNVVESTINSLRRKLEIFGSEIKIKNTRFIGYWVEK